MSEPVIELIAEELETRLATVTEGNGYHQTLTVVRPSRRGIDSEKNNLAVITQDAIEVDEDIAEGGICNSFQQWKLTFGIELLSRQSDTDDTPVEKLINRLWADCIQAITRKDESDEATWHTFGDNALNAWIRAPEQRAWDAANATASLKFSVQVQFRTAENDPYTRR